MAHRLLEMGVSILGGGRNGNVCLSGGTLFGLVILDGDTIGNIYGNGLNM